MRAFHLCLSLGLAAAVASPASFACDPASGERKQLVFLEWDHRSIERWEVVSSDIRTVELPNGFELGLKIEAAPPEIYARTWEKGRHAPETVKISLFDASGETPVELTSTFGGANSVQAYGAGGGADRVEQLGEPGITLTLLKPVCVPGPVVAAAGH